MVFTEPDIEQLPFRKGDRVLNRLHGWSGVIWACTIHCGEDGQRDYSLRVLFDNNHRVQSCDSTGWELSAYNVVALSRFVKKGKK